MDPGISLCRLCTVQSWSLSILHAGVEETIRHALFECRAHDGIRTTFVERAEEVCPEFGPLSQDARFRLLMAEDRPKEIDMLLCRYLTQIVESRERGPPGPAQGVGPKCDATLVSRLFRSREVEAQLFRSDKLWNRKG